MPRESEPQLKQEPGVRRPYSAPRLRCLDLQADQVLSVGCKTLSGGTSSLADCAFHTCGGEYGS